MSKTTLKKLLLTLSSDRKDDLILDLYSARAEAKEYLDFFVDPDIDKLLDKTLTAIAKEINRKAKRQYLKPRITKIRALIKKVATLNPGREYVVELMICTIEEAAKAGSSYWFSDAHDTAFARILTDTVILADETAILSATVGRIKGIIDSMTSPVLSRPSKHFKAVLQNALDSALASLAGQE